MPLRTLGQNSSSDFKTPLKSSKTPCFRLVFLTDSRCFQINGRILVCIETISSYISWLRLRFDNKPKLSSLSWVKTVLSQWAGCHY